jgi:hypothetical protein
MRIPHLAFSLPLLAACAAGDATQSSAADAAPQVVASPEWKVMQTCKSWFSRCDFERLHEGFVQCEARIEAFPPDDPRFAVNVLLERLRGPTAPVRGRTARRPMRDIPVDPIEPVIRSLFRILCPDYGVLLSEEDRACAPDTAAATLEVLYSSCDFALGQRYPTAGSPRP